MLCLGQGVGNGQTKPGADACPRSSATDESLEDMRQHLRLDTGARIVDTQRHLLLTRLDHDRDRSIRGRELKGIVEQYQQNLLDGIPISRDG